MSRSPRPCPVGVLVLALAVAGAVACERKPRSKDAPAAGGERSLLGDAPFMKLVPQEAPLVVASAGAADLARRVGWGRLLRHVPQAARAEAREAIGFDLLDPEAWAGTVLDNARPLGVAWLRAGTELIGIYVPVTDDAKAEALIDRMAKEEAAGLEKRAVGKGRVFSVRGDDEMVVVLRDRTLVFVVSDRGRDDVKGAAEKIAALGEDGALPSARPFRDAVAGLGAGRHLALYVDVPRILEAHSGDASREEREWIRRVLGPITAVAAGLDLGDKAITGRLVVRMPQDALLRELVTNGAGIPAALAMHHGPPLLAATLHLDVKRLMSLVWDVVRLEGGDATVVEARRGFRQAFGMDLEEDVLPQFTGEVGIALTGDLAALMAGDAKPGGVLILGVHDANKAQALFEKVAGLAFRPAGAGAWEVPDVGTVHLAVGPGRLALATVPALAAQAAGAGAAIQPAAFPHPELARLLGTVDVTGALALEAGVVTAGLMVAKAEIHRPSTIEALPPGPPPSDAFLAKRAEPDKVRAEIDALERTHAETSTRHLTALSRALGTTGLVLRETDAGLELTFGQYLATPLGESVDYFVTAGFDLAHLAQDPKLPELETRRDQLERELEALRDASARHDAVPLLPPPPVRAPLPPVPDMPKE